MVSSVSFFDHRIGSNAEQATASVPTEAVVVAQPGTISSGIGSSTARIARFANEIERMGGGRCEGLGPPSIADYDGSTALPVLRLKSALSTRVSV